MAEPTSPVWPREWPGGNGNTCQDDLDTEMKQRDVVVEDTHTSVALWQHVLAYTHRTEHIHFAKTLHENACATQTRKAPIILVGLVFRG